MNSPKFRKWLRPVIFATLCIGAIGWLLVCWTHVTSPRIVAQSTMPNGVEMMIEQTFTWSGDLFNTSFHYRHPGGEWVWRYYSHEDGYWGHGRVEMDEPSRIATVYRGGKPTIQFNWDTLSHTQFTDTQDGNPRSFTVESDR